MNPDPRLTAYALGELESPDREAFERDLAASPELQAELQSLIPLCDELMKTLPEESDVLTEGQRAAARSSVHFHPKKTVPTGRPGLLIGALAAASFVFALAILSLQRSSPPPLVAQGPSPDGGTPVSQDRTISAGQPVDPEITTLLPEGKGFADSGRLDLAFKRSESVLAKDRYNIAARRLAESVTERREAFAQNTASNETRSQATPDTSTIDVMAATATGPAEQLFARQEGARKASPSSPSPAAPESSAGQADAAVGGFGFSNESSPPLQALADVAPAEPANSLAGLGMESYEAIPPNGFFDSLTQPLSTFSIDVDTASYANVRRFLNAGQLPPAEAVRIEELINYFPYVLPAPDGGAPFSVTTEVSRVPWNPGHLLARIALKGRDLDLRQRPASNLVFLVDVSGSMASPHKLPLLQRSLRELVTRLAPRDRVAIVTYAGNSGVALPSTEGREQARILDAIDRLVSGGSTNGAAGIQLAYEQAREHFLRDGNNRVILCTDGDFNVGVSSRDDLAKLIERERKSGVFLSVLGFGTGNLKDATMENLADRGNGNYAYIDSPSEGRKVLIEQMGATLFAIAKDVKIQVEFNPATVAGYRLIGYENRLLAKEDFNDDTKDAGEIGAGHAVTALYEIVPAGQKIPGQPNVDPLKYQTPEVAAQNPRPRTITTSSNDLFTVKLRSKAPEGDVSKLIEKVVGPEAADFPRASGDLRFATAVAAFGMKLRGDRNDATMAWSEIQRIARESLGEDPGSYRAEFLVLVEKAKSLAPDSSPKPE